MLRIIESISRVLLLICLMGLTIPSLADTPDCADYGESLQLMQTVENLGMITCLETTPGLVVAGGDGVLVVLSRSTDGSLQLLSSLALSGLVIDFALCNDVAVLAMGPEGLVVVDLADPANPIVVGTMASATPVVSASCTGMPNLVAISTEDGIVRVINVALPVSPVVVGEVNTGHPVRSIAGGSSYLYAGGEESLLTIDLSDPALPVVVDTIDNSSPAFEQFVANFSRLTVADGALLVVGTYWFEWSDEWSSYYEESPSLQIFDLSNPSQPAFTAWAIDTAEGVALGPGFAASVSDNELNIFHTGTLIKEGSIPLMGTLLDVVIADDIIYLAAGDLGIQVVDATDPRTTMAVQTYGIGDSHMGASARYDVTLRNTGNGNWHSLLFQLYSLADPMNPTIVMQGSVGGMNSSPGVRVFDVQDDFVCFGASSYYYGGPMGVTLYDFSVTPYNAVSLQISADQLVLDGDIAWVKTGQSIKAVSFSDFSSPMVIGSLDIPGDNLQKIGGHWFLYGYTSPGIQLLDLSDPTNPQPGNLIPLPSYPRGNTFHQGHLLFAMQNGDLAVVDPQSNEVVSTIALPGSFSSFYPGDDWVMVLLGSDMRVLSLEDPSAPVFLTPIIPLPISTSGAAVQGDFVYVANNLNGPQLYDLTNPALPTLVGNATGPGGKVYLGDDFLRTAGGVYPLHCFSVSSVDEDEDPPPPPPLSQTLLGAAVPNPFNPSTELKFTLKESQNVELAVYDLRGKLVKTLISQELDAGPHEAFWNGQDNAGLSVPSGVYFARLNAGDYVETRKLALVK